ncbi:MAG: MFS transporter, partial [Nitrososphaerales archaeon]
MSGIEEQNISSAAWRTLIILSFLGVIVLFDETMILPAIPDFIRDFNISYSTSSWLLSAYIIAAAVMTPIAGKMSDIYGKKKILLIVMGVYIVGVLAGRFATNIEFMLAARAAQGVGMAMFPIAFGIIREVFPEKKLATAQTIFGSTFPGGAVIGLVGGAAIIQNFGWQATFLAILPVAIALWLTIVKFVHVQSPVSMDAGPMSNDRTLDIKGTLTLAATIILFLTGITFLESGSGGAAYQVAGLFATSGVSLAAFIVIEKRVRSPLLDFKLMT